jgi:outer membrane immunogenic protein
MNRLFLASIAVAVSIATPTLAADMPVKAPPPVAATVFNWTGFYLGAHVGYGWGRTTIHDIDDFCLGAGVCPTPSVDYRFRGVIGGVQAGYNWQSGNLVIGAEADVSWSGMSRTIAFRPPGPAFLTTDIDWFGTGRLRLGYAFDRSLLYATGGAAFVDLENTMQQTPSLARASAVKWGWTAGGGWEQSFAPNWSVKAEYLFVEVEKTRASIAPPGIGRFEWDNHFHIVRLGLNYRFGPSAVVARY